VEPDIFRDLLNQNGSTIWDKYMSKLGEDIKGNGTPETYTILALSIGVLLLFFLFIWQLCDTNGRCSKKERGFATFFTKSFVTILFLSSVAGTTCAALMAIHGRHQIMTAVSNSRISAYSLVKSTLRGSNDFVGIIPLEEKLKDLQKFLSDVDGHKYVDQEATTLKKSTDKYNDELINSLQAYDVDLDDTLHECSFCKEMEPKLESLRFPAFNATKLADFTKQTFLNNHIRDEAKTNLTATIQNVTKIGRTLAMLANKAWDKTPESWDDAISEWLLLSVSGVLVLIIVMLLVGFFGVVMLWRCEVRPANEVSQLLPAKNAPKLPSANNVAKLPTADNASELPTADNASKLPITSNVSKLPVADNVSELPVAENDSKLFIADSVLRLRIDNVSKLRVDNVLLNPYSKSLLYMAGFSWIVHLLASLIMFCATMLLISAFKYPVSFCGHLDGLNVTQQFDLLASVLEMNATTEFQTFWSRCEDDYFKLERYSENGTNTSGLLAEPSQQIDDYLLKLSKKSANGFDDPSDEELLSKIKVSKTMLREDKRFDLLFAHKLDESLVTAMLCKNHTNEDTQVKTPGISFFMEKFVNLTRSSNGTYFSKDMSCDGITIIPFDTNARENIRCGPVTYTDNFDAELEKLSFCHTHLKGPSDTKKELGKIITDINRADYQTFIYKMKLGFRKLTLHSASEAENYASEMASALNTTKPDEAPRVDCGMDQEREISEHTCTITLQYLSNRTINTANLELEFKNSFDAMQKKYIGNLFFLLETSVINDDSNNSDSVKKKVKDGMKNFLSGNGICNDCSPMKQLIQYKVEIREKKDFHCPTPKEPFKDCDLLTWISYVSELPGKRLILEHVEKDKIITTLTDIKSSVTNKTADYAAKTQNLSSSSQNCTSLLKLKNEAITDLCNALPGGVGIILGSMLLGGCALVIAIASFFVWRHQSDNITEWEEEHQKSKLRKQWEESQAVLSESSSESSRRRTKKSRSRRKKRNKSHKTEEKRGRSPSVHKPRKKKKKPSVEASSSDEEKPSKRSKEVKPPMETKPSPESNTAKPSTAPEESQPLKEPKKVKPLKEPKKVKPSKAPKEAESEELELETPKEEV